MEDWKREDQKRTIIIIIIIINEKISMAFSPKKLQGHVTHKKDDMFGRQRKKQEGQQRRQYEVANKYVFNITNSQKNAEPLISECPAFSGPPFPPSDFAPDSVLHFPPSDIRGLCIYVCSSIFYY